jgi:thioredoxin-dependent peroxiredoxin
VVGVSRDAQETNERFRESLGLPYPLVGDVRGEILAAYKVGWPVLGLARRVTYLISKNRHINLAFHSEFNIDQHVVEVCATLARPDV